MKKSTILKAAAAATAVSAGASYAIFNEVMNRKALIYPKVSSSASKKMTQTTIKEDDPRLVWLENQELQKFEMINDKNYRLKGYLIPSEEPSDVYVFCSHGYRSTGKGEFKLMAKFYHDLGFNVFWVDHQSHGESDGKYIGFGFYESKDCLLWLNWLIEKFGKDIQIILEGVSMGSATVMMMSGNPNLPKNVKFTVADCGYTTCQAQFEHCMKNLLHLPKYPILPFADFFNKVINGYNFIDSNPIESVSNAQVPILFIHGGSDDFVPTYMAHQLYAACTTDKDLLIVDGAAHAESYKRDSAAYEAKVKEFVDKYITK